MVSSERFDLPVRGEGEPLPELIDRNVLFLPLPTGMSRMETRGEFNDMSATDVLYKTGSVRYLMIHFGNRDTTLVEARQSLLSSLEESRARTRIPDLLIAFNGNPESSRACNGYVISEQGKPPDFVLEVASAPRSHRELLIKRDDYAALGIPEYWRFDITGEYCGARLLGDMLDGGSYRPAPVYEAEPGVLQGYSPALNLWLRWEQGRLVWWDPAREAPIKDFEYQKARYEEHRARYEEQRARYERAEAEVERLEGEIERLERENRRLRGDKSAEA